MSRPTAPIVCDGPGCTNRKQESNHWWTVQRLQGSKSIILTPGTLNIECGDWMIFDACGQDCALKIVSEQMGKVTT
jgi:hypothetical protein